MDVSAAVMVVSDRGHVIDPTILLGVRCDISREVNVRHIVIIESFDE